MITAFDIAVVYGNSLDDVLSFVNDKDSDGTLMNWAHLFGKDLLKQGVPQEDLYTWLVSIYEMFEKAVIQGFTPIRIDDGLYNTTKQPHT